MDTGHIYIARLGAMFELKTPDKESLIEAVPAYDKRCVTRFCRVGADIEEDWKRRIDAKNAKEISEIIAKDSDSIINLLNEHDDILDKKPPGDDAEENSKMRMREIEVIKREYDLFEWVYEKFLDVLCLNKDEAVSFITSRPHILKPGASTTVITPLAGAVPHLLPKPVAAAVAPLEEATSIKDDTEQHIIHVPRNLWEGKRPSAVCEGMKKADYDYAVIAHVLHEWCDQTDTAIGKLLHVHKWADPERGFSEIACRRRSKALRQKAAALTITTDKRPLNARFSSNAR